MKKILLLVVYLGATVLLHAQGAFSIATDLTLLRSINKDQKFWAVGQDVRIDYHLSEKESAYTLVNYYTNGKATNTAVALAKDTATSPRSFAYNATTKVRYRQISVGLKHYFKGQYNTQDNYSIYGFAGFGLLFGNVTTTSNLPVDTALYTAQPIAGSGHFNRLTFDIGAGAEVELGTGIYLYSELRTWFPASSYPSPYLYNNDLPRVVTWNTGIRVLID